MSLVSRDRVFLFCIIQLLLCASVVWFMSPQQLVSYVLGVFSASFTFWFQYRHRKIVRTKKSGNREPFVRARVALLQEKLDPDQSELIELRGELHEIEQKKGYQGPR